MSTFNPNDKIVCIDATPMPLNCDRHLTGLDFTFPNGFLEEGDVYCIQSVGKGSDGYPAIKLVGLPVFLLGQEVSWNGQRFRKVARRTHSITAQSKQHLLGRAVQNIVHRI